MFNRLYFLVVYLLIHLILIWFLFSDVAIGADTTITLTWDFNSEEDVVGYEIHYGKSSRFDVTNPEQVVTEIKTKWCAPLQDDTERAECEQSWVDWCTCKWVLGADDKYHCERSTPARGEDLLCDKDYFQYDKTVDVGNVNEYTVTGLEEGQQYYFAATAISEKYIQGQNFSRYSIELTNDGPRAPTNLLKWVPVPKMAAKSQKGDY